MLAVTPKRGFICGVEVAGAFAQKLTVSPSWIQLKSDLLDDYVREPNESSSIGIILCKERDHFEVEEALRNLLVFQATH
ncbi:MAG: DUF1016 family protein [Cellvibrionaceae bacterium]|nr:DUF1016 family protein [Cellvibrionaceae bacterium]